ncbi:hypothetical protein PAXINDRAFT_156294 [Paxillus involutus ATCC 200175]|uniref:Uncharacterized protein n=1 Tax=Paxillus involutus ATCC 200175 TaxID=664439 RepID=A0A0C9U2Q6_PAXIN|nr:hypothetical protein PAXINDRAFT_156294 [Paxillus involutus ATCC 200175]
MVHLFEEEYYGSTTNHPYTYYSFTTNHPPWGDPSFTKLPKKESWPLVYTGRSTMKAQCEPSHRDEINLKLKDKRNKRQTTKRQTTNTSAGRPRHEDAPTGRSVHVEEPGVQCPRNQNLSQDTARIEQSLLDITGGSSRATLERVEVLESRLQVLRSGSSGGDEVKKTSERMRLVARVLEDLLLNAMEGADIGQMHSRGVLLYQSSPKLHNDQLDLHEVTIEIG